MHVLYTVLYFHWPWRAPKFLWVDRFLLPTLTGPWTALERSDLFIGKKEGALLATVSPSNVVQFGDQVLLYCTPSPDATEPVSWAKDPLLVIQTSGSNPCHCTAASNGTSRSVFLNVTDDADIAVYVCTVQLSFVLTCSASVQIFKAVPPVLTAVGSTSQTANQGSTVTFSVSLTDPGLPLANVVWSKDGVPPSNTSNMVVTSTTLQLSNIQPGDRGQYVATATNKAGSSDIHFRLFESFYPVVNLSVITSGSQAMLQCDAYGYPMLTEVTIVNTSSISNIYTQDDYTSGGRATSTQQLTGCPTTFRCRASNNFGMTTVVMPTCAVLPPVLTAVGNTSQTVAQGSTVTFSVSLTNPGLPLANVVWSKDGVPLSNTSNMVVTSTTLQLSSIQVGDRGQYVATATNKAGSVSASFSLFVQFYPVVNLSVITSGSQTMLQCDAYGYPVLTEVTIVDTSSTSNIYTQDDYTSGGCATSTQQLTGCPTAFRCRASNSFGITTVATATCTG
eukprot:Em0013g1133a